jgi:UDP-3-O-[3-hydroxymyristoyl] glucosamine N-acyltransferase
MPRTPRPIRLAELAAFLGSGCVVEGDETLEISGFASLGQADSDELVFIRDASHCGAFESSSGAAVLAPSGVDTNVSGKGEPRNRPVLRCDQPARDFSRLIKEFAPIRRPAAGVAVGAFVDASAVIDSTASIGVGAVVGPGCRVGARTVIASNATLVGQVTLGCDCWVHSGAVLREDTLVGDRVVLQPGVVLGADGFGYAPGADGRPIAIAQRGRVVIEDDVEIGANSTVDRATLDETRIRRGAKIDNLVQIGHNCDIGEDVLIVAQSGLSGGTIVARGAIIMAQSGTTGHLRVGERAFLGARAGVHRDVPDGARVFGSPAVEEQSWHRSVAALKRLPDLLRRVRRLEKSVEKSGGDGPSSGGDSGAD